MTINAVLTDVERAALDETIRAKFSALTIAELQLRLTALVLVKNRFIRTMKLANWQYVMLCIDHCHERIIDLATDGMVLTDQEVVDLESLGSTDLAAEHRVATEVESNHPDAHFKDKITQAYCA